ncbi:MAG: NnrU family protein [Alcanivorax sp.]|nr:NnrU family protein [Alcanivorax sp.]
MTMLILGLVLFLGIHCTGFAPAWRDRQVARFGANGWKGLYSLVALAGFVLIIWGFQQARLNPVLLYTPPVWMGHLNALFTLIAFILLAAAYVPGNRIRSKLGHPMVAGTKIWAFGHLLSIGFLRDAVLFGAFLVWAIVAFARLRRRDRARGVSPAPGTLKGDVITVVVGVVAWALFAFWLHGPLIGVRPFG